jgi:hypothetical protein
MNICLESAAFHDPKKSRLHKVLPVAEEGKLATGV